MTDSLKLSSPTGKDKASKISSALELANNKKRIKELEKNIADLEALKAKQENAEKNRKKGPANKIGARQNVSFKAVSTAPSINKTPVGSSTPALPYPTTQDLSNSVATTPSVRFNNDPVLVLDQSKQPAGTGDEPGSAKGIRSGTVNGEVKPTDACKTMRCEGKRVVRENDSNTMNGGNNPGIYVTTQKPSGAAPKDAAKISNPPLVPETPKERSVLDKWWDNAKAEMGAAVEHPVQGAIGAAKGLANLPSELLEMMAKGSASHHADKLQGAAMFQAAMGYAKNAADLAEGGEAMRANAANIEVPKFPMVNKAEAGGNLISMVVQFLAGGSGLVKSGLGMLGTVGKVSKAVETAGNVAKAAEAAGALGKSAEAAATVKAAANAGKAADAAKAAEAMPGAGGTMQAAKTSAQPAGTGVKILERVKKPREQSLERPPGKNAGAGTEVQDKMRAEGKLKGAEGETQFQASDGNLHGANSIGVPATRSANPLSSVLERDVHGNEIMYRTMSKEQHLQFMETGRLPATTETSISPSLAYSSKYDGVTVKITTAPGTSAQLQEIGIAANKPAAVQWLYAVSCGT